MRKKAEKQKKELGVTVSVTVYARRVNTSAKQQAQAKTAPRWKEKPMPGRYPTRAYSTHKWLKGG